MKNNINTHTLISALISSFSQRFFIFPISVLLIFSSCNRDWNNPTDPNGNGDPDNIIELTINTPSNLQTSKLSDTSLQLTWTDNSDNEEGFSIERVTLSGDEGWTTLTTKSAGSTSHTDIGLTIDETYTYRVKATHSYGDSEWSNETSQTMSSGPDDGFVEIAGGTFDMGSTSGDSDEQPIHTVTVSDFWMSPYELTHKEFIIFLNAVGATSAGSYNGHEVIDMDDSDCAIDHNGSFYFGGSGYASTENTPVIEVTWYGAVEYCNWSSGENGLDAAYTISGNTITLDQSKNGYRLPTEAEWEYAAGGGSSGRTTYAGTDSESSLGTYAWYSSNSGSKTHEVGGKQANSLGLYDMSGNVWEWCWDWYGSSYYSNSPSSDPAGPSSGSNRVSRGGGWRHDAAYCRVAFRYSNTPTNSSSNFGFRAVRSN